MPRQWLELKLNRLFPASLETSKRVKEPMSYAFVEVVLVRLARDMHSTDHIRRRLAFRDACIVIFGFFHLLRASEIVALRVSCIQAHAGGYKLLIARSKTDRAGRGIYIPVLPSVPILGRTSQWITDLLREWSQFGSDPFLCIRYDSKRKDMVGSPISV